MRADITDAPTRDALVDAWFACLPRQQDTNRATTAPELLRVLANPANHWFHGPGPGTFVLLRQLFEGGELHLLTATADGFRARPAETAQILHDIMQEAGLRRLTAFLPASPKLQGCRRLVALLGFRLEGRLRQAVSFDGTPTDIEVWGALPQELRETANGSNTRDSQVVGASAPLGPGAGAAAAGTADRGPSGRPPGDNRVPAPGNPRRRGRRKKRRRRS